VEWKTDHEGLDRYLEDTETVDWQTPAVLEMARELTRDLSDDDERIRALDEFVREEIAEPGEPDVPVACRASHVLRERAGLGHARCILLAALLRSRGFPAAFGYQRLRREGEGRGHVLHGFVAVWRARRERWEALGLRQPESEAGEETYDRLFARPLRPVLDVLARAPDVGRARAALPGSLQG